jgi:hypothetical protein
VCERALHAAEGDEAEALVLGRTQALTRFANNAIHQNVAATVRGAAPNPMGTMGAPPSRASSTAPGWAT